MIDIVRPSPQLWARGLSRFGAAEQVVEPARSLVWLLVLAADQAQASARARGLGAHPAAEHVAVAFQLLGDAQQGHGIAALRAYSGVGGADGVMVKVTHGCDGGVVWHVGKMMSAPCPVWQDGSTLPVVPNSWYPSQFINKLMRSP